MNEAVSLYLIRPPWSCWTLFQSAAKGMFGQAGVWLQKPLSFAGGRHSTARQEPLPPGHNWSLAVQVARTDDPEDGNIGTSAQYSHIRRHKARRLPWAPEIAETDMAYAWSKCLAPVYAFNLIGLRAACKYRVCFTYTPTLYCLCFCLYFDFIFFNLLCCMLAAFFASAWITWITWP